MQKLFLFAVILACLSCPAIASADSNSVYFNLSAEFSPPTPINRPVPSRNNLARSVGSGITGFVEMSLMVDESGKVFAPVIERSTHKELDSIALQTASSYRFKPAMVNQVATVGRASVVLRFNYDFDTGIKRNENRIRQREDRELNALVAALNDSNADESKLFKQIDDKLHETTLTFCGRAFAYELLHQFADKFTQPTLEVDALQFLQQYGLFGIRTTDKKPSALCFEVEEDIQFHQRMMIQLTQMEDWGAVYREAQYLADSHSKELRDQFSAGIINDVRRMTGEKPRQRTIVISEQGYVLAELFSRQVEFTVTDGHIDAIRLRCDAGFIERDAVKQVKIDIPPNYGQCEAELQAPAGTTVSILERL